MNSGDHETSRDSQEREPLGVVSVSDPLWWYGLAAGGLMVYGCWYGATVVWETGIVWARWGTVIVLALCGAVALRDLRRREPGCLSLAVLVAWAILTLLVALFGDAYFAVVGN